MHTVSAIEPQKKRAGFYNIYIDGQYRLSLSELDLASWELKPDQQISTQELDELMQGSLNSKAYNYSLRYLAARARSKKEIADYLARKGFEPETIEVTIQSLEEQKYLNDLDFAKMWIRNRLLLSPRSTKILRLELYKKGVDKETINAAIADINEQDYQDALVELINKKRRQYSDDEKLTQYLIRKGYSYSSIKTVLDNLSTSQDESENNR